MMSVLHPPAPPERVATKETKSPLLLRVLHSLGITRHDSFDKLQGFHPPAYHPLSQEELSQFKKEQDLKNNPPVPFSVQLDEVTGRHEGKTETLMRTHKDDVKKRAKEIGPIDPKSFLEETTFTGEGFGKSAFTEDTDMSLAKSLAGFEDEVHEKSSSVQSDWMETSSPEEKPRESEFTKQVGEDNDN